MDLSTKLKITAVMAAVLMAVVWAVPVPAWRRRAGGGRLSLGHRRAFGPIVRNTLPLACMPSGSSRDRVTAAAAAADLFANLGDNQGLGQQVDVDVVERPQLARRDDGANAVQAHVGERHTLEAAH
jgi:hypothetical protein